jgi:hypothetical protein
MVVVRKCGSVFNCALLLGRRVLVVQVCLMINVSWLTKLCESWCPDLKMTSKLTDGSRQHTNHVDWSPSACSSCLQPNFLAKILWEGNLWTLSGSFSHNLCFIREMKDWVSYLWQGYIRVYIYVIFWHQNGVMNSIHSSFSCLLMNLCKVFGLFFTDFPTAATILCKYDPAMDYKSSLLRYWHCIFCEWSCATGIIQ